MSAHLDYLNNLFIDFQPPSGLVCSFSAFRYALVSLVDFLKDVSSQTTGNNQTVIVRDEPIVNAQMLKSRCNIAELSEPRNLCETANPNRYIGIPRLALRLPGSPLELTIAYGWLAANPALWQRYRRQSPILFRKFLRAVELATACQRPLVAYPGHTALRDYIASYELIIAVYKRNERFVVGEQLEIETTEILVELFATPNSRQTLFFSICGHPFSAWDKVRDANSMGRNSLP